MKFEKLRIVGFKSFCEATEFVIEPGLTGVVGPNGCGKSNLVEAMRWVMGESSFKNMRASGMDDVIFSGAGDRPARNMAEVGLVLDNADRTAPAGFNDSEEIEVTRKIERDAGSTYRINGREARARDVQLLFADASTGARSPAMVRQGQIGEIISAKPQQRRRILEEAAGVAGLHTRRHEAELRLKAAEENLARLEDVLKQVDGQVDSLKKQARQATRYKNLAAEIRRCHALLLHIGHRSVEEELSEAQRKLEADTLDVAERVRAQAEAARGQAVAAYGLPELRDAESKAGAALQRLVMARDQLAAEEKRAAERAAELDRRLAQFERDLARERTAIADADAVLSRLESESGDLERASESAAEAEYAAKERLADSEGRLAEAEAALHDAQTALSDINARRGAFQRALDDESARYARFEAERAKLSDELAQLVAQVSAADQSSAAEDAIRASDALEAAEKASIAAETRRAEARAREAGARGPLADAERVAHRLEAEVRTLTKLLERGSGDLWPPVVEEITVEKGYEAALGAALGDDLEASTNDSAPAHWAMMEGQGDDPPLPPGVRALAEVVAAPPALARRLSQIGIVLRGEAPYLRSLMKVGQRLVSREGDLWRWDGFAAAAEAPTPAAKRLAEKNRLGELRGQSEQARALAEAARARSEALLAQERAAADEEARARQAHRAAAHALEAARQRAAAEEKQRAQRAARRATLEDAIARLSENRDEADAKRRQAAESLANLSASEKLATRLERARALAAQERAEAAEARAAMQSIAKESAARERRRAAIVEERESWIARRARADSQISDLEQRIVEARDERESLADAPHLFLEKRRALMAELESAERARAEATDKRVAAESQLAERDREARTALDAMSAAREERARSEARAEALDERRRQLIHAIAVELECAPSDLPAMAGLKPGAALPDIETAERRLDDLKADRERLGAVNLRADDELSEIESKRSAMTSERDDLTEAIRKLRLAIQNLNREGRERLTAAFEVVNGHFKDLFTTLFGGGSAELQLVESDDPLEAGLEILARPPGKKPQTMTLLSGGEQALTAMSLIFAVFLTNPSPICVLDEVDAPLDDSNVERFCDLLDGMRRKTDTRFVTITHNPITMARMDRLFGVTMAERGVSQLVSVDLEQAERFLEAV